MALLAALAKKSGAIDPRLITDWESIVGEDLARLCRPVRMKSHGKAKTLEIAVANGPAAMAAQFRQQIILDKVNNWLGRAIVTRLAIRQTGNTTATIAATKSASQVKTLNNTAPATAIPTDGSLSSALNRLKTNMKNKYGPDAF